MEDVLVWAKVAAYFGMAIAIGLGTLGPALGQGMVGSSAVKTMGQFPEMAGRIQTMALLALVMLETLAIFAFLTVFLLFLRS